MENLIESVWNTYKSEGQASIKDLCFDKRLDENTRKLLGCLFVHNNVYNEKKRSSVTFKDFVLEKIRKGEVKLDLSGGNKKKRKSTNKSKRKGGRKTRRHR